MTTRRMSLFKYIFLHSGPVQRGAGKKRNATVLYRRPRQQLTGEKKKLFLNIFFFLHSGPVQRGAGKKRKCHGIVPTTTVVAYRRKKKTNCVWFLSVQSYQACNVKLFLCSTILVLFYSFYEREKHHIACFLYSLQFL